MLGFRSVGRVASSPRRSFARPSLEALESRYTPDAHLTLELPVPEPEPLPPPSSSPVLTISVEYGWGKTVTLSGALSGGTNVGGVAIDISGQADGITSTDANGHYTITLTADGLGMVYAAAVGTDATAMDELWDVAPEVTSFTVTEGAGGVWTFSGSISYHRPFDTMTITFGGVPITVSGGGASANSSGSFTWLVTLNGTASDNGLVWAEAVSPWGLVSDKAYDNVYQTGT